MQQRYSKVRDTRTHPGSMTRPKAATLRLGAETRLERGN
jgi:hypothetical protein